jgi:hypothetical protein
MWNATFYDDETGYAYRVRVKRLTVGDAMDADMLGDDITRREDLHGRKLLTLSQVYPFVRYATAACERAVLKTAPKKNDDNGDPVVPKNAKWEPFELTEGEFLALPEWFMMRWQTEAIHKNPHRNPIYEALKKNAVKEQQLTPSGASMNAANSSETPSANASSSD